MAIATTIIHRASWGDKVAVTGQSVLSGATGTGDVVTGLNRVDAFLITVAGASQQGASVNETLPLASGTVTAVVETNDSTFNWIAIGS